MPKFFEMEQKMILCVRLPNLVGGFKILGKNSYYKSGFRLYEPTVKKLGSKFEPIHVWANVQILKIRPFALFSCYLKTFHYTK